MRCRVLCFQKLGAVPGAVFSKAWCPVRCSLLNNLKPGARCGVGCNQSRKSKHWWTRKPLEWCFTLFFTGHPIFTPNIIYAFLFCQCLFTYLFYFRSYQTIHPLPSLLRFSWLTLHSIIPSSLSFPSSPLAIATTAIIITESPLNHLKLIKFKFYKTETFVNWWSEKL